jgi:hypothetical protein
MDGTCRTQSKNRNAYGNLVTKPEGWDQLKRFLPLWQDNIKLDLGEITCDVYSHGSG